MSDLKKEFLDEVMDSKEVAEFLKMHVKTVCRLAKMGCIPAWKFRGVWRYSRTCLVAFLQGKPPNAIVTYLDSTGTKHRQHLTVPGPPKNDPAFTHTQDR